MSDAPSPPSYTVELTRRELLRRAALVLGGTVSAPAVLGVLAGCEGRAAAGAHAATRAARATVPAPTFTPRVLTGDRHALVATVAEHIIPTTNTPGARAAGVQDFADVMLAEYYPAEERVRVLATLAELDRAAGRQHGRAFLACTPEVQRALLTRLDAQSFARQGVASHHASPPAANPDTRTQPGAGATPVPPTLRSDTVPSDPVPSDTAPRAAGRTGVARADTADDGPFTADAAAGFRTLKELTVLGYYTSQIGATRELRYLPVPGRYDGCVPLTATGRAPAV